MSGRRVGLLFGSFNPVHTGHLILAEHFATRTDLAEVWLVVTPHNPFKAAADLLPDTQRLRLVQLAIAGNSRLRAEDIEFGLPRPATPSLRSMPCVSATPRTILCSSWAPITSPASRTGRNQPACWPRSTSTCTPAPVTPVPI